MTHLPDIPCGDVGLLVGPNAERDTMLTLTAHLALKYPVHIIDAGNQFNVYCFTRHLRRHTVELDTTLGRIHVARAFTCYQVLTLFRQAVIGAEQDRRETTVSPLLIFDLLSTFGDESITVAESYRLLYLVCRDITTLRPPGPILVSVRLPPQPERHGLLKPLRQLADQIFYREAAPQKAQPRLF